MKQNRQAGKAAVAFVTLLVAAWFVACGAAFWFLYTWVTSHSPNAETVVSALQWMTWPFTVLAISGPIVVILAVGGLQMVRDILDMRLLIEGLPRQAKDMQDAVETFRTQQETAMTATGNQFATLREQLLIDVSMVKESLPGTVAHEEAIPSTVAHVEEFLDLYGLAQRLLFGAFHRYNARTEEPLIFHSGGGNFRDITNTLRSKLMFRAASDDNEKVADFVERAFELERTTRGKSRATLTAEKVAELKRLKPPPSKATSAPR